MTRSRGLLSAAAALWVLSSPLEGQSRSGEPPRNPNAESQTTIYEGVSVLDGTGAPLMPDMSIVVRDGRIAALAPANELSPDAWPEAEIEDARGMYVNPGTDREPHASGDDGGPSRGRVRTQPLHLRGRDDGEGHGRRRAGARGTAAGGAGRRDQVAGHPLCRPARGRVLPSSSILARGTWATGLKTYASIEGPLLARIAAEARRQGIPVWSHTHVGPALPMDVATAGVTSMSHVCSLASAAIPDEVVAEALAGRRSGMVEVDLEDPRIDAVLEEMKRRGTVLDATLKVGFFREEMIAARDTFATPLAQTNAQSDVQTPDGPPPDPRRRGVRAACSAEEGVVLTRRAHAAGVLISTGTDAPAGPTAEWPALHDELAFLHERVGMPVEEVIRAATRNGALALALEADIGTIEEGKYANLVFLQENPTAGVESLKSVRFTLKRGRRFDRNEFELGAPPRRQP